MEIISRARWGAKHDRGFAAAPLPAREIWLHHSVTAGGGVTATFETDAAGVRLLEQIGESRFGGGISYTFVVTESGRVFEGHGVERRGAHTGGRNSIARAICLLGDYSRREPTGPQLAAVAELLAYGHRAGWWTAPRLNGGHRDAPGASTACPGEHAHARIAAINQAAGSARPHEEDDDLTPEDRKLLREVHEMLRALKPGVGLPARSANCRAESDDHFGSSLHAWAEAADARAGVTHVSGQVASLAEQLAGLPVGELDYDQLAAALLRRMAGG
jgi:hypothetical protein